MAVYWIGGGVWVATMCGGGGGLPCVVWGGMGAAGVAGISRGSYAGAEEGGTRGKTSYSIWECFCRFGMNLQFYHFKTLSHVQSKNAPCGRINPLFCKLR